MAAEKRTMKKSEVTHCCLVLLLVQISVSAGHRQLNSINDLKQIDFGQSVPRHSLLLLYWFANEVNIDYNDVIRLTFENSGDYGTHHYRNAEGVLDQVPRGYRYYTVGNVAKDSDRTFPSYVLNPPAGYTGRNSDRIIIRVLDQSTRLSGEQRIYQVFLTQHDGSRVYDPSHTYEITVNLLRQIRQFSVTDNRLSTLRDIFQSRADDRELRDIRNTWGHLACLGLFLFIVIEEKYSSNQRNNRPVNNSRPVYYDTPVYNDTPAYNERSVSIDMPDHYDTPSNWCCRALMICFVVGIVIVVYFILRQK